MPLTIRPETPTDYPGISEVNDLAFGQPAEGKLVEKLRKNPKFVPRLSLVAETEGKIVGHILFFPIIIKSANGKEKETISLAPVSVLPEFQKQGIGGELIKEGLKACRELGYDSVIVLGHPEYYPRFGFEPTVKWGIKDPFGAPEEAFMALELKEGALEGAGGVVEYPEEFNDV
ncbi:N-acetyltransferase [Methanosarcina sp. KYL-1]|uniref:GNAT family N-acetyltransferase n=1 Tax=Methanosarcina sp. KYL-1 TaxID=2602068 RepID=UPI0021017A44|nr:N-acetyltransferase [Methanosarcina sp. KYL-1]MCQ1534487.1 N-acetyltransferase [Methanosarcina sp. KYL-1]